MSVPCRLKFNNLKGTKQEIKQGKRGSSVIKTTFCCFTYSMKTKALISLLALCLFSVFHLQDGNCPHVVVFWGISTWLMTWSWDGTPLLGRAPALLLSPYGLTWLQRECGKILVKMWYVAAALAGTLLEPPDVLFFASGGYDTLLRDGFATVRPHHFWKMSFKLKK